MPSKSSSIGRKIFVAYPWRAYRNREKYKRAYTKLESAYDVEFSFAEKRTTTDHVLAKIREMIDEATFGIYDVTGWNPNVTLEYGMAKGMGRLAYLVHNPTTEADVPSDIKGLDRSPYEHFDELTEVVEALINTHLPPRSGKKNAQFTLEQFVNYVRSHPNQSVKQVSKNTGWSEPYLERLVERSGTDLRVTKSAGGVFKIVASEAPKQQRKSATMRASR